MNMPGNRPLASMIMRVYMNPAMSAFDWDFYVR